MPIFCLFRQRRADRNIFSGHITIHPLVVISWVNILGISFFDVEKLVAEKLSRFMTNTFKIVFFFLFIQRGCLDSPVFWWGPPTTFSDYCWFMSVEFWWKPTRLPLSPPLFTVVEKIGFRGKESRFPWVSVISWEESIERCGNKDQEDMVWDL